MWNKSFTIFLIYFESVYRKLKYPQLTKAPN